jgi:hypothetical protein
MRPILVAAVAALALHPGPAHAFVPAGADVSCPRSAHYGTWIAYAHTFDGAEVAAYDTIRFAPGRLEVTLRFAPLANKKAARTIMYEVEKLPIACVARTVRYEVFRMTWDLELTSNDELTFRATHAEQGTHVVRLRRAIAP